jgi:hypothetical protein
MPTGYSVRNALILREKSGRQRAGRAWSDAPLVRRKRYKCPNSANSVLRTFRRTALTGEAGHHVEHAVRADPGGDPAELLGLKNNADLMFTVLASGFAGNRRRRLRRLPQGNSDDGHRSRGARERRHEERRIARDAQQPFAWPLDLGAMLPIAQEDLLRHVLGLARIAKNPSSDAVHRAIVHEHGEPKTPGRHNAGAGLRLCCRVRRRFRLWDRFRSHTLCR